MIQALMACFGQFRIVSNTTPVQLWSYGPFRHQEARLCYAMYHAFQACGVVNEILIFASFFIKYYQATSHINRSKKLFVFVALMLLFIAGASLSCAVTLVFNPSAMQEQFEQMNNNAEYSIIGIIDLSYTPSQINFLIIVYSIVALPVFTYIIRKKFFIEIRTSLTSRSTADYKASFKGLFLQNLFSFILIGPIYAVYVFTVFTKMEIVPGQFLIIVLPTMSTILNPLITCYSVRQYREQVWAWLRVGTRQGSTGDRTPTRSPAQRVGGRY